jgi:CRP/FNR family cyclic AMP-dependent transcriptional regulator
MVTKDDLKQIVMLTYLTDSMREALAGITDLLRYDKGEVIFKENEPAERFFMLHSGYVLLEQKISDKVTVFMGSIKPGFSFGWSAMLADGRYTSDAVSDESSEVLSFRREKARQLFELDPEMGFRLVQRVLVVVKKRLDHRTEQFRQAIKNHPDMQGLFSS